MPLLPVAEDTGRDGALGFTGPFVSSAIAWRSPVGLTTAGLHAPSASEVGTQAPPPEHRTRGGSDTAPATCSHARLEVIEGTGHCSYMEDTVRFNEILVGFLAREVTRW